MKTQDFKQKTLPELNKILKELKEKMFEFKALKVHSQLKKSHLLKEVKKNIARVLTAINQAQK